MAALSNYHSHPVALLNLQAGRLVLSLILVPPKHHYDLSCFHLCGPTEIVDPLEEVLTVSCYEWYL